MPNDRLLTDGEIAKIIHPNLPEHVFQDPERVKYWIANDQRIVVEAQDAKALKAVGEWLEEHCCVTFPLGLANYSLMIADVEALKRGEMPGDSNAVPALEGAVNGSLGSSKEELMEFRLNKTQRQVVHAAAREDGRPILQCVHLRKGVLEATDGFILAQRMVDYQGDEKLLLDAKQLASHRDCKEHGTVVYTESVDSREVRALGGGSYTLQKQSGTFPNCDALFPAGEPVFKIALGRPELMSLLGCLGRDEDTIKFSFYGQSSPVKFEVGENEFKGLIMPKFVRW